MIDFCEVMQRVKNILSKQTNKQKVLDKEVALALKIDPKNYAVIKKRKKIPYESLAFFAKQNKLNMNWLLFAQNPKYLT